MRANLSLLPFLFCTLLQGGDSGDSQPFRALLKLPSGIVPFKTTLEEVIQGPPSENAPLEKLVDYWRARGTDESASPAIQARLLEACEQNPDLAMGLLCYLPKDADTTKRIKAIWDNLPEDPDGNDWRKAELHDWLMINSEHFRDELIEKALICVDDGTRGGENQWALEALVSLDWPRAQGIILQMERSMDPMIWTKGLTLHYRHEMSAGSALADQLRPFLRGIVRDPSMPDLARVEAGVALLEKPWDGWENWFMERFHDPVEGNEIRFMAMWASVLASPEKWIPPLTKMIEGRDPIARENAIDYLMFLPQAKLDGDALRPMLPWLEDPEWSKSPFRYQFITRLLDCPLPEAALSAISILNTSLNPYERILAARIITLNPTPSAIPALRTELDRVPDNPLWELQRGFFVAALFACGGLNEDESLKSILAYTKWTEAEPCIPFESIQSGEVPQEVRIGRDLTRSANAQKDLAGAILKHARSIEVKEACFAERLRKMLWDWPVPEGDDEIIRRLGSKQLMLSDLMAAIDHRETLKTHHQEALLHLSKGIDCRAALASVLLEDASRSQELLSKGDAPVRMALLASARMLHFRLPLGKVALQALQGGDLMQAADQYLKAFNFQ